MAEVTNESFKELIKLQIKEPLNEIELSKNIKILGEINDGVSQKVKSQYEENPYPRWRYGDHYNQQKLSILQSIKNEINMRNFNNISETNFISNMGESDQDQMQII